MPNLCAYIPGRGMVATMSRGTAAGRRLLFAVLLLTGMAEPVHADHFHTHRRVLLINSYHPGYVWSDRVTAAIGTRLRQEDPFLEFSAEFLDAKHFDAGQLAPELEKFLQAKYRSRQPDLLITADDDALHFLLPRRNRLFPGVPVVFCGINNFSDALIAGQENITGVAENADIAGTIGLILRLQPGVRQIAFISDSSESGRSNRQRFLAAKERYQGQVAFIDLSGLTLDELKAALRRLPADSAIVHTTMFRDRNGATLSPEGSLALLTEFSQLPIYSMWEHGIGREGVGGMITSAELQGDSAAALALRILHGEPAARIAVLRDAPVRPMFNDPVLRRYRIDPAALPAESVIMHRPFSFYETYKTLVWTVTISLVLLSGLVLALLVNIRSRHRAMKLLRERKNQLQQIIECMPVGVCLADRHGKIITANSAGVRIWGGAERVGIEGYGIYKGWWHGTGRSIAAEEWGMARAILKGETSLDELIDIEAFDGERKTIAHSAMPLRGRDGEILGGLVVIQDVTERLRSERTLQALANEWQNTFNAVRDAIALLDRNFRILHCNKAFAQLVALEPRAVLGHHCWELVHHSAEPVAACPYARMLDSHRRETSEYQLGEHWWETRVDPILDDDGTMYGAIHIISDITERKRAEREMKTLLAQLEQRNTELEQFTYSVSHDLKTPLVTIGGFVGQLRYDLEHGQHETLNIDLDFIESSARQMGTLLDNLLHLARSGRVIGDPQPVDLASIVQQALELARGALAGSSVQVEFAAGLPRVAGDADRLREVFQILIENAAKFSRGPSPARIEVAGEPDGDRVLCRVRDHGIGIPPQYLERIFGLFERLDESCEGTGVGLALARRIVEQHGGRIWAESAGEGRGSTFFLLLPRSAPDAGA